MPQFCFYVAFEMITVFDIDRKRIGNLLSGIKAQFQLFHWFDLLCDFPPQRFSNAFYVKNGKPLGGFSESRTFLTFYKYYTIFF